MAGALCSSRNTRCSVRNCVTEQTPLNSLSDAVFGDIQDGVDVLEEIAFPIDVDDRQQMLNIVNSCIGTKFTTRFGSLMSELALDAVKAVTVDMGDGKKDIDIKKYAKVEKIPGGNIEVRAPRASGETHRDVYERRQR